MKKEMKFRYVLFQNIVYKDLDICYYFYVEKREISEISGGFEMPSVKIVKETVSLYPEKIKKKGSILRNIVAGIVSGHKEKHSDSKSGICYGLIIAIAAGVLALFAISFGVAKAICRAQQKKAQQRAIVEDIFDEIEELEEEALNKAGVSDEK